MNDKHRNRLASAKRSHVLRSLILRCRANTRTSNTRELQRRLLQRRVEQPQIDVSKSEGGENEEIGRENNPVEYLSESFKINFQIFVLLSHRESLICFIFTLCYILWLFWPNIWWNSFSCWTTRGFCELNFFSLMKFNGFLLSRQGWLVIREIVS